VIERLRSDKRPLILILIAILVLGGFFLVVAPLFATNGAPSAALGGTLPSSATAGKPVEIDVGYDNTGQSVINPTCLLIDVTGPLQPSTVDFQGLDVVPVKNGEACGGALNGQETISMRVVMQATAAGTAQVTLTPAKGNNGIGPGIAGSIPISGS
jgi:hypothetical protein